MLAMYVVLENYLQMVCDYPVAYEGQEGFSFIKSVPTTWDETKVINAGLNEYITVARRKNRDWYVGAITNHSARNLDLSFSFLEEGSYRAEIFRDTQDTNKNPNHLIREIKSITNSSHLSLSVSAGGGFVIKIHKVPVK